MRGGQRLTLWDCPLRYLRQSRQNGEGAPSFPGGAFTLASAVPRLEVRCHSAKGGGNVTHLGRRRDRRRHHSKSGLAPVALTRRVRRFRRDRGAAATLLNRRTNQPRMSAQYIKSGRHLAWPAGNRTPSKKRGAGRWPTTTNLPPRAPRAAN